MAESSERGRAKAAESKAAPLSTPAVVNGGLEERESAVLAKGSDHRGRKLLSGLKNLVHSTSRTRSRSTQPVVPHTSRPTITHESAEVLNPTLAKTTAEGRLDPQTSFPIAELWNHAYEELRRKDSKLIEKYENQLSLSVSVMAGRTVTISDLGKVRRRDEMDELVKRKLEDDEKGKWRLPFGDDRIAIRDMTEAVVNIVAWAQEFVGDALEASPYGSLAWVGVCLLLP
ncbi:hypothetical protein MMC12_008150, partial [Toensbergia leucococca]|nr:hypothetical protein [Toensbergia leucococca]